MASWPFQSLNEFIALFVDMSKKTKEKVSQFSLLKGKLKEWTVEIGNKQLRQTSRLSDAHFLDENIIKKVNWSKRCCSQIGFK